jgi:RNA polymerase sigma-70 factor, ECF subfamily
MAHASMLMVTDLPDLPQRVVGESLTFEAAYEQCFDFVWRSVRRLGVDDGAVDDVVQEVFLIVHRKLNEFAGRSSLKTWVFGILLRVVNNHRRTQRRKSPMMRQAGDGVDPDSLEDPSQTNPHENTTRAEATIVLHRLLDELDDEKRAVFVMAHLEEMPVPEIAEAIGTNLNTVYSRLRSARKDFEQAVQRYRAQQTWRGK